MACTCLLSQAPWIRARSRSDIDTRAHSPGRHCCFRRVRAHADHTSRACSCQGGSRPGAYQPGCSRSGIGRGSGKCVELVARSPASISARIAQQLSGLYPTARLARLQCSGTRLRPLHHPARINCSPESCLFAGRVLDISEWRFLLAAAAGHRCKLAIAAGPRRAAVLIHAFFPAVCCISASAYVAGGSFWRRFC